jgi:hypothetical protein
VRYIRSLWNFYSVNKLYFEGFILGRNRPILGFFKGLQGEGNTASDTALASAIEAVYYIRNKNFIGPLSFSKSLLVYSKTGASGLGNILFSVLESRLSHPMMKCMIK